MENAVTVSKEDISDFLFALRDTGAVNMFGATPYLMDQFGMTKYEARDTLIDWMESGYRDV